MYVCVYVCTYVRTYARTCVYIYIYICIYIYIYIMYIYIYIGTYIYIYIYIHTRTRKRTLWIAAARPFVEPRSSSSPIDSSGPGTAERLKDSDVTFSVHMETMKLRVERVKSQSKERKVEWPPNFYLIARAPSILPTCRSNRGGACVALLI